MKGYCFLHCGIFTGLDTQALRGNQETLQELFPKIRHDPEADTLEVCGSREIHHDPETIIKVFNLLASVLSPEGKGQIMLHCDGHEVCYFRRNMWKLLTVFVPEDPFEVMHYVAET
ncbi:MAG: hypothetical protein GYA47_14180 [Desulfovibrio sp.]|nr:hypothetical protein [Desulfovibrio sp.]